MRLTVIVLIAVIVASAAQATIIDVPGTEPTIAAGIAATSPGDTVMIECGTYYENLLVIDSSITLTSETGFADCVTIDGSDANPILTVRWPSSDGAVISGITFTNGYADQGGAMFANDCDITIHDCLFELNDADVQGGGLFYWLGNPTIYDCEFGNNDAAEVGGNLSLYETGGSVTDCDFLGGDAQGGAGVAIQWNATTSFSGCHFSGNHAWGTEGYGGGIYCGSGCSPMLQSCLFYQNGSDLCGGGAACDSGSLPVFVDCRFELNTAQWGGGLYASEPMAGGAADCTFTNNEAQGGAGGLIESSSNYYLEGCWFEGNVATEAGGGAALVDCSGGAGAFGCTFTDNTAHHGGGLAVQSCTSPTIAASCTFVLNQIDDAGGAGGGIALGGGTTTMMSRCIVAFSTLGEAVACEDRTTITAEECAVFGNEGGDWVDCLSGQEPLSYNSDEDPLFCDMYGGNFYLCENSYCHHGNNIPGVLIGSHQVQCDQCDSPVELQSWGSIKALYR